nr:unnamed protein product [Callosobruchus analis]
MDINLKLPSGNRLMMKIVTSKCKASLMEAAMYQGFPPSFFLTMLELYSYEAITQVGACSTVQNGDLESTENDPLIYKSRKKRTLDDLLTSKTNTNGPTELDTFLPQDNSITNGVTKVAVFSFPGDENLRKKLLQAIPRANFVPSNTSKVTKGNDLEAANAEFDPFKNRQNDHPTTNLNTLTHLLKASLGTGILSMPAAFQAAGLALGIFSTILVSIICTHCAYILVTSAHELYKRAHKTKMSFADVAEEACLRGPKWARGFAGPIRNFNYVIDYYMGYTTEIRVTIAALLVPIILLVYVPNLKYLAPVSMIANVFMGIGLGITFYYLVTDVPSMSERNLFLLAICLSIHLDLVFR